MKNDGIIIDGMHAHVLLLFRFTAPCNATLPKKVIPSKLYAHIKEIGKEGMFFVSHAPIDVDGKIVIQPLLSCSSMLIIIPLLLQPPPNSIILHGVIIKNTWTRKVVMKC